MNIINAKSISETAIALRETFEVFRHNKPLTVGITVELEGYSRSAIKSAMSRHCATTAYLRNVKYGLTRFNLDNTTAEDIKPEHKEMARLKLNVRTLHRTWNARDLTGVSTKSVLKKRVKYEKRVAMATERIKEVITTFKSKV